MRMLTKVAVLFTLLVKTLSPYSVFFIFLKEHQVVCQVMLSKTMNQVESYVSNVRMKRARGSSATDQNNKLLNSLFSGTGLLFIWMLCTVVSTVGILLWFKISPDVLARASSKDWMTLVSSCVLLGLLIMSIVLLIAMIFDVLTAGMFLKMGFNYLKWDSELLSVLERFLRQRPIEELERVKLFLEHSPPYNIFAEPIKKSLAWIFSLSVFAFSIKLLFNAGKEGSLMNSIESLAAANLSYSFLGLEAIVGCLLVIVAYYKITAQLYDQKTKRVVAIIDKLIVRK